MKQAPAEFAGERLYLLNLSAAAASFAHYYLRAHCLRASAARATRSTQTSRLRDSYRKMQSNWNFCIAEERKLEARRGPFALASADAAAERRRRRRTEGRSCASCESARPVGVRPRAEEQSLRLRSISSICRPRDSAGRCKMIYIRPPTCLDCANSFSRRRRVNVLIACGAQEQRAAATCCATRP